MTLQNMILAATLITGCERVLEQRVDETQAPQEDVKTLVFEAVHDARIREASPNENFGAAENGYVGSSADGFDRYLMMFMIDSQGLESEKIQSAKLVVDVLSGTCLSSYNNQICNLPIKVGAYKINGNLNPNLNSGWQQEETVTWANQPDLVTRRAIGNAVVQVPYQGTGSFKIDVTRYVRAVANGAPDYGIMLKAANDTEETREFQRQVFELDDITKNPEGKKLWMGRETQRDVLLGSKEGGHPARLVITYQ